MSDYKMVPLDEWPDEYDGMISIERVHDLDAQPGDVVVDSDGLFYAVR